METLDRDGCSSTCQAEACYWCSGAGVGTCSKYWANGVLNNGVTNGYTYTEVWDVLTANSPCTLNWCTTIQTGYVCPGGNQCKPRWGDGIIETDTLWGNVAEKWDDGNTVSGDGWRGDWQLIEADWEWPTAGTPCRKICGNGIQDNPFSQTSTQGTHFSEDCDYSLSGNNLQSTFKDIEKIKIK